MTNNVITLVVGASIVVGLVFTVIGPLHLIHHPLALWYELRQRRRPLGRTHRTPLVTVVVPAYNEGRVLASCVESVLADSYPRKQVVLVDDGSTDDTLAVMRRFEAHPGVTVLTQPNGGKAVALNTGISSADGEVLLFCDADGIFTGDTIVNLLAVSTVLRSALCAATTSRSTWTERKLDCSPC